MKFLFVIGLAIFGFFQTFAQERYVEFVDEAKKDASFYTFRTKLIEAAKKRDVKYILSILDNRIMNSFGGGGGIEEFKKDWKINDSKSQFWDEFSAVINNGGAFYKEDGKKQFHAPYTYARFPNDLDGFEHSSIFGSNVNLRSQPSLTAPVVASLSYNVVKIDDENSIKDKGDNYSWFKVETLGGKKGFVKAEYVRSPIDYRAGFEKKKGKWVMIFFIAGD